MKGFPPPDKPYQIIREMELTGVAITSVETLAGQNHVICTGMVAAGGEALAIRFCLTHHRKSVRRFFRAVGIKQVPRVSQTWDIDPKGGGYFVRLDGHVTGEDNVPEGKSLTEALVMENVKMRPLF